MKSKRSATSEAFIESINELIDAGEHDTVIEFGGKELASDPRSHVLRLLIANSFLIQDDLHESLKWHLSAIETHECVHTIWHLAYHMKQAGAVKEAIALWESVVGLATTDDDQSMTGRCNRRCCVLHDRAAVIANARYMLSVSYLDIGRPKVSERYKRDYMLDLASGVKGMFSADTVEDPNKVNVFRRIDSA
jgi:hypothetical protein